MGDSIGFRFQIYLWIPDCVMSTEFTRTFSFINVYLPSNFVYSKPSQSVRDMLKIFNCSQQSTVYYVSRNADLNLILK